MGRWAVTATDFNLALYMCCILDHIAVVLHVSEKVCGLTLHLPAQWCAEPTPHFHDNKKTNILMNPGKSANKLHKQFTEKIGEKSLEQIQCSALLGAKFRVHDGFKLRNTAVARDSQYLIAFTWNDDKIPKKSSGTYDTWQKHSGKKIHIPIGSLVDEKGKPFIEATSIAHSSEGASCSSTGITSIDETPASCSSVGGSLEASEENPKCLEHQSQSADSGCYSGDSQSLSSQSSFESPVCISSASREHFESQEDFIGTKRKNKLYQSESPKKPRLN